MYWKSEEFEIYFNEVMSETLWELNFLDHLELEHLEKNRTWKFMVQILNQQQILEEHDDL